MIVVKRNYLILHWQPSRRSIPTLDLLALRPYLSISLPFSIEIILNTSINGENILVT